MKQFLVQVINFIDYGTDSNFYKIVASSEEEAKEKVLELKEEYEREIIESILIYDFSALEEGHITSVFYIE